jgi:hypothetical protein
MTTRQTYAATHLMPFRTARRKVVELVASNVARALFATVSQRRVFAVAWRISKAAQLLTPLRASRERRAVADYFFVQLLQHLSARRTVFDVPYERPDLLLDVWEQHGAVLIVGLHNTLSVLPMLRAIRDARRECSGIVGGRALRHPILGTTRDIAVIPAGPRSLIGARRALLQGKAFVVVIDQESADPKSLFDRKVCIDGRCFFIYGNSFRLAMLVGVPIIFHCARMQDDGSVAFALDTPRCLIPTSEDDVRSCLDDYEDFIRKQIAAGWL